MESNSDKSLRDKLKGVEFSFDPHAWAKMEVMLDEKKKRRGFFWWWTGGIAAALLFTMIGYEVGVGSKLRVASDKLKTQIIEEGSRKSEGNNSSPANSASEQQKTDKPLAQENQKSPQTIIEVNNREQENTLSNEGQLEIRNQKSERKGIAKNQSSKSNEYAVANVSGLDTKPNKRHSLPDKKKLIHRKEAVLTSFKNEETNGSNSSITYRSNPFKQEVEMLASAATQNSMTGKIEMDRRTGLLESSEEKYSFDKKTNEDSLPKKKKNIFNYSVGVLANISGTTVGSQTNSSNERNRPSLFYNKPTYAVGFTHEFLFLNRIAISNSILFSQTGFKVYNPSTPADSSSITKNYSAAISELQIPVGIKVYPVVKKYFRFYIAVGIINHIKLTEKFTVEKQTYSYSVVPNNIVSFDNTFVSSTDNPFMQGLGKNTDAQGANGAPGELGEYYGMGGLRRYYASFYASTGVEFIAKKHFVFFTEPMFYLSLKKIGLQEKRKYNVGVSGGFRYQF